MAFLWKGKKNKNKMQQNPSPTCVKKCIRLTIEKSSLLTLLLRRVAGGMTVEASVVLPMCLVFLINLGSVVEMIRLHNNLQLALWDSGSRLALYGCEQNESGLGTILSEVYLKNRTVNYLGEEYLENSPLSRGSKGLIFWESDLLENDSLDIKLTYKISPFASLVKFSNFRMGNRFYIHLWNGYAIPEKGTEVTMVYVTEHGLVCHRDRDCTHIKLSVRQVDSNRLEAERNQWGNKYVSCDKCVTGSQPQILFVTGEGHCFHYRENCSGLKRTVRSLTPEEAAIYPYCSRCGKDGE